MMMSKLVYGVLEKNLKWNRQKILPLELEVLVLESIIKSYVQVEALLVHKEIEKNKKIENLPCTNVLSRFKRDYLFVGLY